VRSFSLLGCLLGLIDSSLSPLYRVGVMEEGRGMEELEKICICLGIGTTLRAVASQVEGPSVLKLETNPNNPPITNHSDVKVQNPALWLSIIQ
jgi:hypothetical protein